MPAPKMKPTMEEIRNIGLVKRRTCSSGLSVSISQITKARKAKAAVKKPTTMRSAFQPSRWPLESEYRPIETAVTMRAKLIQLKGRRGM
jgi:hypothetical protein